MRLVLTLAAFAAGLVVSLWVVWNLTIEVAGLFDIAGWQAVLLLVPGLAMLAWAILSAPQLASRVRWRRAPRDTSWLR